MNWLPSPDSTGEVMYGAFGHFTVGDQRFYNNVSALTAQKILKKPINWHYYDDVWAEAHDKGLWRYTDLNTLYSQRARQLRQDYEHVTLLFSGGWDSRNILETFEREGLHIDAVVVYVIPELSKHTSGADTTATNWYGEIEYHALPYAKAYCNRHPGTKLIEIPWVQRSMQAFEDLDQLMEESRIKPGFWFGRSIAIKENPEMLKELGNKRGCLISGIDKPCIIHNDFKSAQGFFPEGILRYMTYPMKTMGYPDNQIWEAFYWTPDLPELAIRGWYELLNLCRKNPYVAQAHNKAIDIKRRFEVKMSRYVQDAMKTMLYSTFNPVAWQADKQNEWGFFMTFELPVVTMFHHHEVQYADKLGEILKELERRVGEDNLIIGDKTAYDTRPWVNQFMSDRSTVLDYKTVFGQFINLDMDFVPGKDNNLLLP